MPQIWSDIDDGLEGDYDPERVAADLQDLDVRPEAMEAMEAAGFLGDEGIEYFDKALDTKELGEGTLAAVGQNKNGEYTLFINGDEFYDLYEEHGLMDAAEAMRHEYNHARDWEDDLIPDLRENSVLDPISAYIVATNLNGDRASMEGANQYVTKAENPYDVVTDLEAYPEETKAIADQIRENLPELSEEVQQQLDEQGYNDLPEDAEREVYNVEAEDGVYREEGSVGGEDYKIELEMPTKDELDIPEAKITEYLS